MSTRRGVWKLLAGLPFLGGLGAARMSAAQTDTAQSGTAQSGTSQIGTAGAQQPQREAPTGPPGHEMLTIFLRHDQARTVDEINDHLKQTGWFRDFPPPGVEIVSWYVMMGIGQVVTLRFPAEKLRDLNRLVEAEAWGGYRTEFYPTYDYRQLWQDLKARMQ